MLKASALYLVIIIALIIGLLSSSLIAVAYFYRAEYEKKFRYDQLQNNLQSGINILLTSPDTAYSTKIVLSLFGNSSDSVTLQKFPWGVYDIGVASAHIQKDSLFKTFSIANTVDSAKWAALYLADNDRTISVSGKTSITGDAYLPKAGIQQAYIDGEAYTGDKRLIKGNKRFSDKNLPLLDLNRLGKLNAYFLNDSTTLSSSITNDTLQRSFLLHMLVIDFKNKAGTIEHKTLKGNIILHSDTTLVLDSSAKLDGVLVFAKAIVVKSGFAGNCQLFATDSISVGQNCIFSYPSCMGLIRFKESKIKTQGKIILGGNTKLSGIIFSYERVPNDLKPMITIGKKAVIQGLVYSQNILELKDSCVIHGSVFTNSFLYKSAFTIYENYLINTDIDSKKLSPYYLTSHLIPVTTKEKKVLQWLEGN